MTIKSNGSIARYAVAALISQICETACALIVKKRSMQRMEIMNMSKNYIMSYSIYVGGSAFTVSRQFTAQSDSHAACEKPRLAIMTLNSQYTNLRVISDMPDVSDKAAAAHLLGYRDWARATDRGLTVRQDAKVMKTHAAMQRHRMETERRCLSPELTDFEAEAALLAAGITVIGPDYDKFAKMFAAAMDARASISAG